MPETPSHVTETNATLERRLRQLVLTAGEDDWADRYLLCEHVLDPAAARPRQKFEAVARFVRDLLVDRWVKTRLTRERENPKRIYYLSMEFLIGRGLKNNIINLRADPVVNRVLRHQGWEFPEIAEQEPDAGLGNGGLGRLAACFIDSLATLQYSAMGYGLQYEYGIFRQSIRDGYQVEEADNWLRQPDPWEVSRPGKEIQVPLHASFELRGSTIRIIPDRPSTIVGVPHPSNAASVAGHVWDVPLPLCHVGRRSTVSPGSRTPLPSEPAPPAVSTARPTAPSRPKRWP